jgi:hypothetical protein
MEARKYDKRIEVWETGHKIADGFGGFTVSPQLITTSWAQIKTDGLGRKAYDIGLVEFNDPLLFLVRGRNDLPYNGRNLFLVYKGQKYIIQSVRNEDLRDVDTEIFCTKEESVTINLIGVLPSTGVSIEWGYWDEDYHDNELDIPVFQFTKQITNGQSEVEMDFTFSASGFRIGFRVPAGFDPTFTDWRINEDNAGPIPGFNWYSKVTAGQHDYYLSRTIFYLNEGETILNVTADV